MSESNGKTSTIPEQKVPTPYRPKASTAAVHDAVMRSLSEVVSEATRQAGDFVYLAHHCDRDAGTAIRYGHLVDASECLEIALTHLGQLKMAVNHRLCEEDDRNIGFAETF